MSAETVKKEWVHRGSVKDIYRVRDQELRFEFSDRYSIFDWGTMPDLIPHKGEALARMGALLFEELGARGIQTHYLRRVDGPTCFEVREVAVPRNQIQIYEQKPESTLIPLEVIFRWGVPKGSSLLTRGLGYREGQKFDQPQLEFTTKLETQDRLLSEAEARALAGISSAEWSSLEQITRKIADFLKTKFARSEMELWDGKIEFAFGQRKSNGEREIILVDTIGLDELRVTWQGRVISKEVLRQFYQGTDWQQALREAKKAHPQNFRSICLEEYRQSPPRLPASVVKLVSRLYLGVAQALERSEPIPAALEAEWLSLETQLNLWSQRQAQLKKTPSPRRILILGSGGREHALAWRLAQDPGVERVEVMPGNSAMASERVHPVLQNWNLDQTQIEVRQRLIDLVVVGPEKYLFEGWSDSLRASGVPVMGPSRLAAELEGSKAFAKEILKQRGVLTARHLWIQNQEEAPAALEQARSWSGIVVKISGPAQGKGVVVARDFAEAQKTLQDYFESRAPGIEDGVVLEEKLFGRETSLFFAGLGRESRFLGTACDYKRLKDQDQGPNTGGMGAISPAPWQTPEFIERVQSRVVRPVLEEMSQRGRPFFGILFVGLMGESVLEFNVRWGDPETQAILPILSGNLSRFFYSMAKNDVEAFRSEPLAPLDLYCIHVVKAAPGYPGAPGAPIQTGTPIRHTQRDPGASTMQKKWFFAGVQSGESGWVTAGGRILGLSVWGEAAESARAAAYTQLDEWAFDGEQFRKDIGRETWMGTRT